MRTQRARSTIIGSFFSLKAPRYLCSGWPQLPFHLSLATCLSSSLGGFFSSRVFVGLISTLQGRNAPGFGWSLLSAVVALLAAAFLLLNPLQSLASLPHNLTTLAHVLTFFFIVDGFFMIVYAVSHRREQSGWWELLLVHGVVDFALAGFLLTGLPDSALWALALLVGLDLAFGGLTLVRDGVGGAQGGSGNQRLRRGPMFKRG